MSEWFISSICFKKRTTYYLVLSLAINIPTFQVKNKNNIIFLCILIGYFLLINAVFILIYTIW